MWQVLVFQMVMKGLKLLAKSSDNTIDDEVIKIVDECVSVKTVKALL